MIFRGGTEAVSVVANKGGGGEGGYRKLAADEGEGGERNQKNGTASDGIS